MKMAINPNPPGDDRKRLSFGKFCSKNLQKFENPRVHNGVL